MNEWEKVQKGYLCDANNDPAIMEIHLNSLNLCLELNNPSPVRKGRRENSLKKSSE